MSLTVLHNNSLDNYTSYHVGIFDIFACISVGFLATAPIVYVGKIGNTYISCVYVACLAFVLARLIILKSTIKQHVFDDSILLFVGICLLSSISTLIYSMAGVLDQESLAVPMKGYVVLACLLTVYAFAFFFWHAKYWIIVGLAWGMVFSFVICLISLYAFNHGTCFSLYGLFPQESFQISAPYGIWDYLPMPREQLITQYRPQGLFREASHLMIFLISTAPLVIHVVKNSFLRVSVIAFTLFATVTSKSPNVLFFIVELFVIWIMLRHGRENELNERDKRLSLSGTTWIFIILLFGILILVFCLRQDIIANIIAQLQTAVADLDVSNSSDMGTLIRWGLMGKALSLLEIFPLGAGWNLETTIMEAEFGAGAVSSHTIFLKYLLEIGPLGLLLYFYVIYRHSFRLIQPNAEFFQKLLGIGVVFMFVSQATNGVTLAPWMWLLLGMAHSEITSISCNDSFLSSTFSSISTSKGLQRRFRSQFEI